MQNTWDGINRLQRKVQETKIVESMIEKKGYLIIYAWLHPEGVPKNILGFNNGGRIGRIRIIGTKIVESVKDKRRYLIIYAW